MLLEGNKGISALGFKIELPEILTPVLLNDTIFEFEPSEAIENGSVIPFYNPTKNFVTLAYSASRNGDAVAEIGSFMAAVSPEAKVGKEYEIKLSLGSISDGTTTPECKVAESLKYVPVAPTPRTLSKTTLSLTKQNEAFSLNLTPAPPADACVWTSSDETVVKVDKNGVVTALGSGSATVTVVCETLQYQCVCNVSIPRKLGSEQLTLNTQGGQCALILVPAPVSTPVVWTSDKPNVASVDEKGIVTAKENGVATITAVCEGVKHSCKVTVDIPRKLSAETLKITKPDEKIQLSLTPAPVAAISWVSNNPAIAAVDDKGNITPKKYGTTVITAVCEGISYTCSVTVQFERKLNMTTCKLSKFEETAQLTLTPAPDASYPVTWKSSDALIASVSADGKITALNNGKTTITGICEDVTYTCEVTVDFPRKLNYSQYATDTVGGSIQLKLSPAPTNGDVKWTSSNAKVAAVDAKGMVKFVAEGSATITAAYEGKTYTCEITIRLYLKGDSDLNGTVDAADASKALQAYVKETVMNQKSPLTAMEALAADVDEDGAVTSADASAILRYYVRNMMGKITWEEILSK